MTLIKLFLIVAATYTANFIVDPHTITEILATVLLAFFIYIGYALVFSVFAAILIIIIVNNENKNGQL